MAKAKDVKVPDIGNYKDVPVIEVLVKNGETVAQDQALVVLESDKSTLEVPSPFAGVVSGLVKVGTKVSEGDVIAQVEAVEASAAEKEVTAPKKKSETQNALPLEAPPPQPSPASGGGSGKVEPSPASEGGSGKVEPSTAAGGGSGKVEVRIPDIGDYKNVPVIEVLVKDGDAVARDAPLLVLESEKAALEVPAPAAGTVRGLKLKVGDKVSKGDLVCSLESSPAGASKNEIPSSPRSGGEGKGEEAVARLPAAASKETPPPQPSPASAGGSQGGDLPYAGPATRKFARELGVDLGAVKGSGPRGRIVVEDVQDFVKSALKSPGAHATAAAAGGAGIPPIPTQDFSQFGEIETRPLGRIRKLSAAHLHRAWLNVPHVTQFDEADITELEAFRKAQGDEGGVKLTLLPFVMKAVSVALKQFPEFNASLAPDGENLVLKKYCHVGFAADTPNGLVVPVVRDVWSKGIVQLASECGELAKKARDGKLKADEMKGGCFSISSLGGLGVGGGFTPIVNAPEVAILGVSRAGTKPVWDGKAFQPRLMLPLSLSYDHRVIDGAYAARFTVALGKLLGDLRRLIL